MVMREEPSHVLATVKLVRLNDLGKRYPVIQDVGDQVDGKLE
jgi:hypothetical protein